MHLFHIIQIIITSNLCLSSHIVRLLLSHEHIGTAVDLCSFVEGVSDVTVGTVVHVLLAWWARDFFADHQQRAVVLELWSEKFSLKLWTLDVEFVEAWVLIESVVWWDRILLTGWVVVVEVEFSNVTVVALVFQLNTIAMSLQRTSTLLINQHRRRQKSPISMHIHWLIKLMIPLILMIPFNLFVLFRYISRPLHML